MKILLRFALGMIPAGLAFAFSPSALWASEPCRIEVFEKGSGWPVPLVELRTTHQLRLVTDNAGLIALDAPELMGRETWFDVIGHGYGIPKDGFGYQGVRLKPEPGKTLRVEVTRTIIAKRLGRLTGAGLFAESQKKDEQGRGWVLFGNPLPALRCPATFEAWQDSSTWEILQPPKALTSAADGQPVKLHTGSMAWNAFRKRWVTVFMEAFGKPSAFGELWYAEAPTPTGPWGKAVKILTHENYTFYNPRLHPEFTPADSPLLIFEGTYTMLFANKPPPTPRYDYNQILYRLDLDDPALAAAQKP